LIYQVSDKRLPLRCGTNKGFLTEIQNWFYRFPDLRIKKGRSTDSMINLLRFRQTPEVRLSFFHRLGLRTERNAETSVSANRSENIRSMTGIVYCAGMRIFGDASLQGAERRFVRKGFLSGKPEGQPEGDAIKSTA
jgi:hypothetical protein